MKKLLVIILLFTCTMGFAQNKTSFKDRLYFGGDVALSFSSSFTIIGAAPIVGYRITDNWSAGVGVSYFYVKSRGILGDYSNSLYGGNVFTRVAITENLFGLSEFHLMNNEVRIQDPFSEAIIKDRVTFPIWYVGGGYQQAIGGNMFITASVLFDLIDDPNSPYINPMFRGGFVFGL